MYKRQDVHLGTKGCQANKLLEFFKNSRSENLYLVGDIIDIWEMQKSFFWPQEHNDVIQKILRKARHGTKVFYIMGNHDEMLRKFIPMHFGDIHMVNRVIHETNAGKKYVVVGENIKIGDIFDKVCEIRGKERINRITPNISLRMLAYFSEFISFFTKKRPFLAIDGLKAIEIGAMASAQKSIDELGFKYLNADQILSLIHI